MPNLGYGIQVDDSWIGGMFDIAGPNTPPGQQPVLGVMIKVENLEATAKKVKDQGGKAGAPMDIFDQGRMVVCHDPNGAQFDLWEPRKLQGTDVDGAVHGAPAWYETLTTDTQNSLRLEDANQQGRWVRVHVKATRWSQA